MQIAVFRENWEIIMGERDKRADRARVLVLGAGGLNGGALVASVNELVVFL